MQPCNLEVQAVLIAARAFLKQLFPTDAALVYLLQVRGGCSAEEEHDSC